MDDPTFLSVFVLAMKALRVADLAIVVDVPGISFFCVYFYFSPFSGVRWNDQFSSFAEGVSTPPSMVLSCGAGSEPEISSTTSSDESKDALTGNEKEEVEGCMQERDWARRDPSVWSVSYFTRTLMTVGIVFIVGESGNSLFRVPLVHLLSRLVWMLVWALHRLVLLQSRSGMHNFLLLHLGLSV